MKKQKRTRSGANWGCFAGAVSAAMPELCLGRTGLLACQMRNNYPMPFFKTLGAFALSCSIAAAVDPADSSHLGGARRSVTRKESGINALLKKSPNEPKSG